MIFSRGRGDGGRHKKGEDAGREARHSPERGHGDAADEFDAADGRSVGSGPYDIADAPGGVQRLDLGSLQIPAVDGVEIRVQANPDGSIGQIVLVHGPSALQLGVFAAPRSTGIWDEVREEIRASLARDGAKPAEVGGEYGTELRAQVRTPDGPADVRFIGIDGPRWMVRAVYQGAAATDPGAAGPLDECLRQLVVDRGREAMPVRDALPLRLPREVAEQAPNVQVEGPRVDPRRAAAEAQAELSKQSRGGDGSSPVNGSAQPGGSDGRTGRGGSRPRGRRSR